MGYIRHYKQLDRHFTNVDECYKFYVDIYDVNLANKVKLKYEGDPNSILGTYFKINPSLKSPEMYHNLSYYGI